MDFLLYFQILRKMVPGFFCQARKLVFCQIVFIYLLNSCGSPRYLDFDITFLYPIIVAPYYEGISQILQWSKTKKNEIDFLGQKINQYSSRVYQKMWDNNIWGVCFLRKVQPVFIFMRKL